MATVYVTRRITNKRAADQCLHFLDEVACKQFSQPASETQDALRVQAERAQQVGGTKRLLAIGGRLMNTHQQLRLAQIRWAQPK